jgi:hypothetical protein
MVKHSMAMLVELEQSVVRSSNKGCYTVRTVTAMCLVTVGINVMSRNAMGVNKDMDWTGYFHYCWVVIHLGVIVALVCYFTNIEQDEDGVDSYLCIGRLRIKLANGPGPAHVNVLDQYPYKGPQDPQRPGMNIYGFPFTFGAHGN